MAESANRILPIGSVVTLRGADKRLVIIGVYQGSGNSDEVYDYTAVPYPEGYLDDAHIYAFMHSDITDVLSLGYSDAERQMMVAQMLEDQNGTGKPDEEE